MNESKDKLFVIEEPSKNSVIVKYLISTSLNPECACIKLCKEQSLSNALGNDLKVIKKFAAKYVPKSIRVINKRQFEAGIVFPLENCENSLSMLLSAMGGDTFNIKNLYPIKIKSVELPASFVKNYGGPNFGVDGIRKKLNCYNRPLLCGPVKPCVGLKPDEFAKRAKEALLGGTDVVKDDELISNPSYNKLAVRAEKVAKAVEYAEKITGEKKMYFAFIGSGSPAQIMKKAEIAKENCTISKIMWGG
ncbi:MAG: hypothetical protein HYW50_00540 [Candidatus Diapherotrites archaeon]|nr:hypothetical protein [Candidatus Diapherotrites archaeon]